MSDEVVDLRSDTVTRPTPGMLDAMMGAAVGDDVYGEDPTVNELEHEVAKLLGKEAALFVPSGTMANQLAIAMHTRPGDSVVTEVDSHCYLYEAGAAAALSGVQFELIPWSEGFSDDAIERYAKPEWMHYATTRLIVVENTHNRGAGRVTSKADMDRIAAKARAMGLATHSDGARIWNAARALGTSEAELVKGYDTVAVCFSKGLGAPVGSALCGPKELIERARKQRKRWGGAMRQAGFLAAAALYALRHHRERLDEDHANARALADELRSLASKGLPVAVSCPDPCTNMVYFRPTVGAGDAHARALGERGVLLNHLGGGWLRVVTHLDVPRPAMERAIEVISSYVRSLEA